MGVLALLDEPYYEGVIGTSTLVPGQFDVAVGTHPYMVDTSFEFGRRDSFRQSSIPAQRSASDITEQPGEGTINPQGLWRSEFQDFSWGSGQRFVDRQGSAPNRFHHSQGIDPFTTKGYATLLPDTYQVYADSDPTCQVLVVGAYVYRFNATGVYYTLASGIYVGGHPDHATWTQVPGLTGTPVAMCSDGNTVYVACGTGGVYSTVAGSGSSTQLVNVAAQNVYFVAYCANTLLVANGSSLYQVSGSIVAWPTALITQVQSTWLWTCACAGNGWIYLAGFAGGTQGTASVSAVYKTQMAADGTTLGAPAVATPLPPGETVYSLFAFVNYILIGTSLGVRFCQTLGLIDPAGQDTGLLKLGPIVPNLQEPMGAPCRCFTANQRFIYFGWSYWSGSVPYTSPNDDNGVWSGLGWLDIANFTGEQTPAYSSHLMVDVSIAVQEASGGYVTSMDWWPGDGTGNVPASPIFVVSGQGIYIADADVPVDEGWIQSGYISFRLPDQKALVAASVDVTAAVSSLSASVSVDDGALVSLGTIYKSGLFNVANISGELFETIFTMVDAQDTSAAIRRTTLQAYPKITAGDYFVVSLRFYDTVETRAGTAKMDVYSELAYLRDLRANQTEVIYQEGKASWVVVVDDINMVWYQASTRPFGGYNGLCMVTMKTAASGLIT